MATGENQRTKSTGIGPRDGKKAFRRIQNILDKLEPDQRASVREAVVTYAALEDDHLLDGEEEQDRAAF